MSGICGGIWLLLVELTIVGWCDVLCSIGIWGMVGVMCVVLFYGCCLHGCCLMEC